MQSATGESSTSGTATLLRASFSQGLSASVSLLRSGEMRPDAQKIRPSYAVEVAVPAPDRVLHGSTLDGQLENSGLKIVDLECEVRASDACMSDLIRFRIEKLAVRLVAERHGLSTTSGLFGDPGGNPDAVAYNLAASLLPSLRDPANADSYFIDNVVLAFFAHLVCRYGGPTISRPSKGGLAPWQVRRIREVTEGYGSSAIMLCDMARSCDISPSYFAKAFRVSFGMPPHRWMLERRIERSKTMLVNARRPISDIANACGFADQSHLTRVFAKTVGLTPGAWRRKHAGASRDMRADTATLSDPKNRIDIPGWHGPTNGPRPKQ